MSETSETAELKYKFSGSIDTSFLRSVKFIQENIRQLTSGITGVKITAEGESSVKRFKAHVKDSTKSVRELSKEMKKIDENVPKKTIKMPKPINDNPIKTPEKKTDKGISLAGDVLIGAGVIKGIQGLASFAKQSLLTTAQIKANMGQISFIFKDTANAMNDFVRNGSQALGMSEADTAKYASMYGNTLKNITASTKDNSIMTQKFLQTTALISQKSGYDIQTVAEAIKSGLLGETESIDKLGIEVKAKVLETTDAFKKMANGRSWEKLTFREQQQVIMMGILEQASKQYGDELTGGLQADINSTTASFTNASNNIKSFISAGLQPLMRVLASVGRFFQELTEMMNGMSEGSKQILTFSALGISALLGISTAIALTVKYFSFLKTTLSSLKAVSKVFSFALSGPFLVTVGLIIAGLVVLSNAFGSLSNVVNNFGKAMQATFVYIGGSIIYTIGSIINAIASLFGAINNFGKTFMSFGSSMISSASNIASSIRGTTSAVKSNIKEVTKGISASNGQRRAMDNATDSNNKNAKSADKASKANKNLKDNLQSFDEINKLQVDDIGGNVDTATPTGGAIETPDIGGGGMEIPPIDTSKFETGMDKIKEKVNNLKGIFAKVKPYITTFLTALGVVQIVKFIANLSKLAPMFKTIGTVIQAVISSVGLIIAGVVAIIGGLILFIKGIIDYLKNPVWEAFKKILIGLGLIIAGVAAVFSSIPALIAALIGSIIAFGVAVYANWEEIKEISGMALEAIKGFFVNAWNSIINAWNGTINFFDNIWKGIQNAFNNTVNWFKDIFTQALNRIKVVWSVTVTFFQNIWNGIVAIFNIVVTWFRDKFSQAWNGIKTIWSVVIEFFKGIWNGIVNTFNASIGFFKNVFSSSWNEIKSIWNVVIGYFSNIWSSIKGIFSSVSWFFRNAFGSAWNGIQNIFSGVGSFFSGIFYTIKNIFRRVGTVIGDAVGGSFRNVVNSILGFANRTINRFINGINWALGAINKIPGVNIGRLPNINVPYMAKGGVVRGATHAVIGEGKYNEAVIPLGQSPQMREMKKDIAQEVVKMLNLSGGNNNNNSEQLKFAPAEVKFNIDGNIPFGKALLKLIDDTERYCYG